MSSGSRVLLGSVLLFASVSTGQAQQPAPARQRPGRVQAAPTPRGRIQLRQPRIALRRGPALRFELGVARLRLLERRQELMGRLRGRQFAWRQPLAREGLLWRNPSLLRGSAPRFRRAPLLRAFRFPRRVRTI